MRDNDDTLTPGTSVGDDLSWPRTTPRHLGDKRPAGTGLVQLEHSTALTVAAGMVGDSLTDDAGVDHPNRSELVVRNIQDAVTANA